MASAVSSAGITSASVPRREPPLAPWRDTHGTAGPAVACLQESFAEDWYWATHSLPPLILPPQYDSEARQRPADAETCSLFFVEMINAAHERVWITSPYFVPDEAVMAALRCGVGVRC